MRTVRRRVYMVPELPLQFSKGAAAGQPSFIAWWVMSIELRYNTIKYAVRVQ